MYAGSSTRTYVGRLEAAGQAVYVVDADGVERLEPAGGGLHWGTEGGGTDLARALLVDATGSDPGTDACRRFAHDVLARLPHDGFSLQRDTLATWLRRLATV